MKYYIKHRIACAREYHSEDKSELHTHHRENLKSRNILLLFQCMVFVELPYSEDMREFVFPPIVSDSNKPTKEQLDSIDALIDNMDLQAVKFVHFFIYF
jgi:hypothetical protein